MTRQAHVMVADLVVRDPCMRIMAGRATKGPLARVVTPGLHQADRRKPRDDNIVRADLRRRKLVRKPVAISTSADLRKRISAGTEQHAQSLGGGASAGLLHVR